MHIHHTRSTLSVVIATTLFTLCGACSHIAEDERLIDIGPAQNPDTTQIQDSIIRPVARRVLIEDHTGQHCPNCPDAADIIHDMQQAYPNLIVPVAIHSEQQGIMEPEGLANELGNTYYRHWNVQFKPAGLVSRMDGGDGQRVLDKTIWIYAVQYALEQPTPLDISIQATYTKDHPRQAEIAVDVICTREEAAIDGRLQVWLTEDSIVATQFDMSTVRDDYVHNHVLRAAVNGTWGEPVSVKGHADRRHYSYTATIPPQCNPEHMNVVAFVYTDEEVMQAAQKEIIHTK